MNPNNEFRRKARKSAAGAIGQPKRQGRRKSPEESLRRLEGELPGGSERRRDGRAKGKSVRPPEPGESRRSGQKAAFRPKGRQKRSAPTSGFAASLKVGDGQGEGAGSPSFRKDARPEGSGRLFRTESGGCAESDPHRKQAPSKMELLAPAGSQESLEAAVRAGADGVYLGGERFGARAAARNFSREALREAVRFCRIRGVAVYVTVNTVVKDGEFSRALEFVRFLCGCGVDAVIIQDLGLLYALRACAPELKLHGSTQMSIHNAPGLALLEELGVSRVVAARELSKEEIRGLSDCGKMELEVFVHGALCMSVSGQCYFSAVLGERSGNRGMCAQPCRLPFRSPGGAFKGSPQGLSGGGSPLPGGSDFALSLKDQSLLEQVRELQEMGVASAKIEGRMKRPEYVASAVGAFRKALDGEGVTEARRAQLAAVFSRSGFTAGYYLGKRNQGMYGVRRRTDADPSVLAAVRGAYREESARVPVMFRWISEGDANWMEVSDSEGNVVRLPADSARVAGPDSQMAALGTRSGPDGQISPRSFVSGTKGSPQGIPAGGEESEIHQTPMSLLRAERCRAQLKKTGGTPYYGAEIRIPAEGLPLSISSLNRLRRALLAQLDQRRGAAKAIPFDLTALPRLSVPKAAEAGRNLALWGSFRDLQSLPENICRLDKLIVPLFADVKTVQSLPFPKERMLAELPRAFFGKAGEQRVRRCMKEMLDLGIEGFLCGNLGGIALCRALQVQAYGGFSLNITNSYALRQLEELGVKGAELSFELHRREIQGITGTLPRGLMIYGRQAVMLTRNCPLQTRGENSGPCAGTGDGMRPCPFGERDGNPEGQEEEFVGKAEGGSKGWAGSCSAGCLVDRKGISFPVICTGDRETGACELLNSRPLYLLDRVTECGNLDFGLLRFTVENPVESGGIIDRALQGKDPDIHYTRGNFQRGVC